MGSYTKPDTISDGVTAIADHVNRVNNATDQAFTISDQSVTDVNTKLDDWVYSDENTPVVTGEYSSIHWASKASQYAIAEDIEGNPTEPTNNDGILTGELSAKTHATAAGVSAAATAADLVLTNADVVLTHADVVLTNADAAATAADRVVTTQDAIDTGIDAASTAQDALDTAADVVLTGLDVDYAAEWAISPDLISTDAGGNGTTDRSAKYHADDAAATVASKFESINIETIEIGASPYTYTKPVNLLYVIVELVGGGGAGGGSAGTATNFVSTGGGGGGGGYSKKVIQAASLGATETVTIGAGGTPLSAGSGGAGGVTSFGSHLQATGGTGGLNTVSDDWAYIARGGVGGVGSLGDINTTGGQGGTSTVNTIRSDGNNDANDNLRVYSGPGGNSLLGGGAYPVNGDNDNGVAATGYGGGGSGAASVDADGTNNPGGAGAPGVVIITEYLGA
jgi:hypothetical protein